MEFTTGTRPAVAYFLSIIPVGGDEEFVDRCPCRTVDYIHQFSGRRAIRDAWWKVALQVETADAVAERIFLRRLEILPKAELRLFGSWIYVVAIERR